MTLSRPIPKALLPHTAVLKTPVPNIFSDTYDEITLYNVRIEQNEKVRQTKSGDTRTRGAKMYFDCSNSAPLNAEFKTEQLVVFCGETYKIEAVKAVAAVDKIHHYRIDLI
ncbi:MAG: minor capsid protein [Oscillospiraceae bacterium]|jgi:ubiquitin|nr:minor capsid protein [Oscillospiraceae bacterium]